jgi:hypothetical protein
MGDIGGNVMKDDDKTKKNDNTTDKKNNIINSNNKKAGNKNIRKTKVKETKKWKCLQIVPANVSSI